MFFCSTTILTCLGKRNVYGEAYTVLFVVRLFGKNILFYQQPGVFVIVIWIPKAKSGPLMTNQSQSPAVNDCIIM